MTRSTYMLRSLVLGSLMLGSAVQAQNTLTDPKVALKDFFWGQLYATGGKTFFCEEPFDRKSVLISEGYIYSTTWMRDSLECGTPWQCRENSADYKRMASDLHNIYPENARFDLDRRAAKFEDLPPSNITEECGYKRSFGIIEPPTRIKGDIARAMLYMITTYNLPLYGDLNQLKAWNRIDPPTDEEKDRNLKISKIQGNENPFITFPEQAEIVTLP